MGNVLVISPYLGGSEWQLHLSSAWQLQKQSPGMIESKTLLCHILAVTLTRVQEADLVGENWCMDGKEITVWVDASSVATGVALETTGTVIEDAC